MGDRAVPLSADGFRLRVLPGRLAIARLPASAGVPAWTDGPGFRSITHRGDELSIVCAEVRVPPDVRAERGWRALEVEGTVDFSVVGLLHALTGPLAAARLSVFAASTFDTDVVLVREDTMDRAVEALRGAGFPVERPGA